MALRTSAKFVRGVSRIRFIPHCGNGTLPSATGGVFGGTGPFDFTAAHAVIAAVPLNLKLDNGAVVAETLDLSTFTETAITAANLVTAITTAAPGGGWTASVDSATGRLKIVNSGGTYAQVYGLAAELAGFGMGIGAQIVKSDTIVTATVVPTAKENTDITVTDANLLDTSVTIPGYVKGATGVVTDTVLDYFLKRIFEGGVITTGGVYQWPMSNTVKPYFMIEIFNQVYTKGENFEGDLVGYKKITVKKCMGSVGDQSHSSEFLQQAYNYSATNYKTAAGVEESAVTEEELTVAQFEALDFENV
jgi:hypothetical protein